MTFQHPGSLTVTLEPHRALGIDAFWNTGEGIEVRQDECQEPLEQLGTGKNWKMVSVNGEPYTEKLLDEKMAGEVPYQLTFIQSVIIVYLLFCTRGSKY